jgi:hypothetical protein
MFLRLILTHLIGPDIGKQQAVRHYRDGHGDHEFG